ncbi:hypothetical protein WN55_10573 [Dufourea novaeangliae]|uniref:Endonuclease/exonuclease/phosphatase domain-containing protein n=1 Tax=Dufourea novaeangliae TaxID=178035 RepID=A0A154P4A5_DUFNO|nr:hypothetical protein WN55_10573 [Dufourea novaeangliae]
MQREKKRVTRKEKIRAGWKEVMGGLYRRRGMSCRKKISKRGKVGKRKERKEEEKVKKGCKVAFWNIAGLERKDTEFWDRLK